MIDYQKLYFHLLRESERAIQTLIAAQQQCEQWYIDSEDTPLTALPSTETTPDTPSPRGASPE